MLSDHIRTFQPPTKTDYKKKLLYSINKFDYISSIFAESDSGAKFPGTCPGPTLIVKHLPDFVQLVIALEQSGQQAYTHNR